MSNANMRAEGEMKIRELIAKRKEMKRKTKKEKRRDTHFVVFLFLFFDSVVVSELEQN